MRFVDRFRRTLRAATWLGPKNGQTAPVRRTSIDISAAPGQRPMRAVLFESESASDGVVLVLPGLHYLGPSDPRVDRFCAALATTGNRVLCPHLPDFTEMIVRPSLIDDAERALDTLLELSGREKIALFSISFGALPGMGLAARRPESITEYVMFGGYSRIENTLRFALRGVPGRPHDPLNAAAVFLNFLHLIDCEDPEKLAAGWRRFIESTWGRPHLKDPSQYLPIAQECAEHVAAQDRRIFLRGVRAVPGAEDWLDELFSLKSDFSDINPIEFAPDIRSRVVLVHGLDDDVIPPSESERLAAAIPGAELRLTGLFDHSAGGGPLTLVRGLARELRVTGAMLRDLTNMGM